MLIAAESGRSETVGCGHSSHIPVFLAFGSKEKTQTMIHAHDQLTRREKRP